MHYAVYALMIAVGVLAGCGKADDKAAVKEPAQVGQGAQEKAAQQQASADQKLVPDVQAGNQLAKKACASCHGTDGVQSESASPFIAGLNEEYIAASLRDFASGSRRITMVKAMEGKLKVMKQLDPRQIADVAAYYAGLPTAWKGSGVGIKSNRKKQISLSQEDIDAGALIAKRCNPCHGKDGNSESHSDAASLAGMPPDYFVYSMKTYFDDSRKHKVMNLFGKGDVINEKMIEQLAAYYVVKAPLKTSILTAGDAKAGEAFANDCIGCHGPDGNSLNSALPNLAGQPVPYLILSMRDYRDDRRNHGAMKLALKGMSDKDIADIAAYFASREPVSQYLLKMQSSKESKPLAEGERIAKMCDSCHGKKGNSTRPGVPNLSGLTARYLTEATIAYRDGAWKHDVMREMVSFLSDEDIEKVSLYYAQQKPVQTKMPDIFDPATGEKILPACILCHSDEGIKKNPSIPNLNGQDHHYLIDATMAYANKERVNEDMRLIAKALKHQDIRNLINVAGYYTTQKATKPQTVMPQPAMKIIGKCHRCHGEKGEQSTADLPRLAGQSEGYLLHAMRTYHDKWPKSKNMSEHIGLALTEMKGIAAYYAKQ
ncbi:MAG: c-type cytochrome [Nitrospirota bacterium]|nr:c-type cytochrome [Nitrospirota bacterium]